MISPAKAVRELLSPVGDVGFCATLIGCERGSGALATPLFKLDDEGLLVGDASLFL